MKKKKENLTFFVLEGVRHDGICSGNQEAVLSLRIQSGEPSSGSGGAPSAAPEASSAVPVTQISQLFYLTTVRSRAQ